VSWRAAAAAAGGFGRKEEKRMAAVYIYRVAGEKMGLGFGRLGNEEFGLGRERGGVEYVECAHNLFRAR
jgi:hypothetical protein